MVLAACLLLDFPENQWLETGTKFLASVQRVPSDFRKAAYLDYSKFPIHLLK